MSDGGKGSAPRPYSVPQQEFSNNWDRIFGKKNEKAIIQTNQTSKSSQPGELDVSGLQQDADR